MSHLEIRPLVAGEESLFESMPDPLPQVRKIAYANGLATGGYRPERTWVAILDGRVVGRAAWVLPPGAMGRPWLERFDLSAEPEVGARLLAAAHEALGGPMFYYAAVPAHWRDDAGTVAAMTLPLEAARLAGLVESGERLRYSWRGGEVPARKGRPRGIRPAADVGEITARIAEPDVLTGRETALAVAGVDLATDPLSWLTGPPGDWLVDEDGDGLAGIAVDACYPLLAFLAAKKNRPAMLAEVCRVASAAGAREVIADVDAHRHDVIADLEDGGFELLRGRLILEPSRRRPARRMRQAGQEG